MELKRLSIISIILLIVVFFTSSTSQALPNTIFPSNFRGAWLKGDNDNLETIPSPANSPLSTPTVPSPGGDVDIPKPSPSPSHNSPVFPPAPAPHEKTPIPGGKWEVLQKFVGVSAMHMQLLYNNKVVIFDSTNFGPTNLSLPHGKCKDREYLNRKRVKELDCSAHSFLYNIANNTFRPLMLYTNVLASSGAVDNDGTLLQSGGYSRGSKKIRIFRPSNDENCDWIEMLNQQLRVSRFYATTQSLPDGRIIIVGGHEAFSYEFFPKSAISPEGDIYGLHFLKDTFDNVEVNNLYPFLHLLPDGNLFIFANQRSILLNYQKNEVVRRYPPIPAAKRSNPLTGSSVLLPLKLTGVRNEKSAKSLEAEVMICGGAKAGAYIQAFKGIHVAASKTCGRLKVTHRKPRWVIGKMPMGRVMPDMLLLPTADVIILNGASKGSAMWGLAEDPVLNPVLYVTCEPDSSKRFVVMNPTKTPRLFQSSAILLPDGRILVGGSNPNGKYVFGGVKYPTDTSLEAFSPHYLDPQYADQRPSISSLGLVSDDVLSYGQEFFVNFDLKYYNPGPDIMVTMIAPSFTTHSFAMNQRLLVLECAEAEHIEKEKYKMTVYAPPTKNIAPPGYYMMFVVHDGVPSPGVWVKMRM